MQLQCMVKIAVFKFAVINIEILLQSSLQILTTIINAINIISIITANTNIKPLTFLY